MRALARAYPAGARFQVRLDLDDYWVLVAAADSGLVRPSPNCGLPWLVMAFFNALSSCQELLPCHVYHRSGRADYCYVL